MKILSAVACILCTLQASAQQAVEGRVLEAGSRNSIPFAHVVVRGKPGNATVSNIEGYYSLPLSPNVAPGDSVVVSCVGFRPYISTVQALRNNATVRLNPVQLSLNEVVIRATEDPGYEVIRRAVQRRDQNNPEKLGNFTFRTYNKASIDFERTDAMQKELEGTGFARSHFFLLESVTKVAYSKPGRWSEEVVAHQTSGIRTPQVSILSNSFQPFSAYSPLLTIINFDFVNPVSPGSDSKYFFELTDTVQVLGHTAYVVSYKPRAKAVGNLLEGSVTIHSESYALVNFRALNGGRYALMEFDIRQDYAPSAGVWFPAGAQTIYLSQNGDLPMRMASTTYYKDVNWLGEERPAQRTKVQVSYAKGSATADTALWNAYRPAALDTMEANVFAVWDTIAPGLVNGVNWMMNQTNYLARGRLNLGMADIMLSRLFGFNNYEGFRLGLGLATSEKLVKWASADAWYAYGFRDRGHKYGGGLTFFISPPDGLELRLAYANDVDEPGRMWPEGDFSFLKQGHYLRNLYTSRMNRVENYAASIAWRPARGVWLSTFAERQTRTFEITGYITDALINPAEVVRTEVGATVRLVKGESLMQVGSALVPVGNSYPRLEVRVARALDGVFDGQVDYTHAHVSAVQQWHINRVGRVQLHAQAGQIWGNGVPYPWLHFTPAIHGASQGIGIMAPGQFQTMNLYEFLNDRYAHGGVIYHVGPVFGIEKKWTKPELQLSYAAAIGHMSESNRTEVPFAFSTMHKPYLEAGLAVNNILRLNSGSYYSGFGLGVFQRHGEYAYAKWEDNLFLVLSLSIGI